MAEEGGSWGAWWSRIKEREKGRTRKAQVRKREQQRCSAKKEREVHVNGRWRQWAKKRRERRRNSARTESIENKPIATCTEVRVQISARFVLTLETCKKTAWNTKNEQATAFFRLLERASCADATKHLHYPCEFEGCSRARVPYKKREKRRHTQDEERRDVGEKI